MKIPTVCVVLLFVLLQVAVAGEPEALSLTVHGRSPVEAQDPSGEGYGLVESVLFEGDPVMVTVSARLDANRDAGWIDRVRFDVRALDGALTTVKRAGAARPALHQARKGVQAFDVTLAALPRGRYIVRASLPQAGAARALTAEERRLTVYRSDENAAVRRVFLTSGTRGHSFAVLFRRSILPAVAASSIPRSFSGGEVLRR